MLRYTLNRLLLMIPVLLGICLIVLLLIDITPGDPAELMLSNEATQEEIDALRDALGLNDPLPIRYLKYLGSILRGDLGRSFFNNRSIWTEITQRFPYTLVLVFLNMGIALLIGIPLGVYAATHQYTWKDNAAITASLICVSMPSFWFALMLVQAFCVQIRLLPPAGVQTWQGWVLPTLSLALGHAAVIARQTRSNMLEVLRQDYITTARAKGQSERKVIYRHSLKNALIPIIMVIGGMFGMSLGGALVTEVIFSIPGLGQFTLSGLSSRDYPVIQGNVLFLSILFCIVMLIVDLVFALVDPRIRSQYARRKKKVIQ